MRHALRALALAAGLCAGTCAAQEDEEAGLQLADQTAERTASVKRWALMLEAAAEAARLRNGAGGASEQRLTLDVTARGALGARWRWHLADRLDVRGPQRLAGNRDAVNTLKELYVSAQPDDNTALDAGRVNVRLGVAYGYNPTDYFREGSLRSVSSVDPVSLRENRLGTVLLRGQRLWNGGSFSALLSPYLGDEPSSARFAADPGATNDRTRWLLTWSQRWAGDLQPQWLLLGDTRAPGRPRLGLNLTRLLNTACVAHLEWSAGRTASLAAQAQGTPEQDLAWRQQLATGLSCSNALNQTLTLEYQHNDRALDDARWRALRNGPLPQYLAYVAQGQRLQDPLTRERWFLRAEWKNAGLAQLNVSGFMTWSPADRSRLAWLEARYSWDSTVVSLQWQLNGGGRLTEFGVPAQSQLVQLLLRQYF